MALDEQEVFHDLSWGVLDWSWHGLNIVSLAAVVGPLVAYLGVATWSDDLPLWLAIPIAVASLATIVVLQWKQPDDWLMRYLDNAGIPRHLDHLRHLEQPPFPVARQDLL